MQDEGDEWLSINPANITIQNMASSKDTLDNGNKLNNLHFKCSYLGIHSFTMGEPQELDQNCSKAKDNDDKLNSSHMKCTYLGMHSFTEGEPQESMAPEQDCCSESSPMLSTHNSAHHYSSMYMGMDSFLLSPDEELIITEEA